MKLKKILNKEQKGYALTFGFIISASVSYFMVDFVFRNFPEISPENAIFWGFWGSVLFGIPFYFRTKKQRKEIQKEFLLHKNLVFIISILTTLGAFLWFFALNLSSSGIISLLFQSEIIFAFLMGVLFLKEKITFGEILGFIISIFGLIILANLKGEISPLAVIAILSSAFFYALQSFFIKKMGQKVKAKIFAFLRITGTTIFLSIFLLLSGKISFIPFDIFILLAISQVFGFFIGRIFYVEAHKYLPISKLNTFLFLQPIVVLIGAYMLFGDTLSSQKILGAVLVLGGLIFFMREQIKNKKK